MSVAAHHLLGTYQAPRVTCAPVVTCEVRGHVVITGLTSARIPWSIAKRRGSQSARWARPATLPKPSDGNRLRRE